MEKWVDQRAIDVFPTARPFVKTMPGNEAWFGISALHSCATITARNREKADAHFTCASWQPPPPCTTVEFDSLRGPTVPVKPTSSKTPEFDREVTLAHLHEIYDRYRDAALNKEYYGRMLANYQRCNNVIEILLAVTASSSGISGLVVFQTGVGKWVWGGLTLLASVLAVTKPILQLNRRVERYSKLFTGHLDNFLALGALVSRIKRRRELTPEMVRDFEQAEKRFIELSRSDDPQTRFRLHKKCEDCVRAAIPDSVLWFPRGHKKEISKEKNNLRKAPPSIAPAGNVADFPTASRKET